MLWNQISVSAVQRQCVNVASCFAGSVSGTLKPAVDWHCSYGSPQKSMGGYDLQILRVWTSKILLLSIQECYDPYIFFSIRTYYGKKKKKFKRMQKLRLRIYCFADQMQLFSKYLTHKFQKFCWEECHKLLCPQTRLCWKKERRTTRYTEWQAKKPSHPAME